ncbi:hypothetical protein GCM10010123_40130 [Pilimelia anulata]|uniref:SapB/AmfS family lantipeptide n=1 Tax=Pilimelia anulata TaxID=53371 RepID=A0A8J3BF66_9ACTN|nr:SapB/AmfS family lanthipeptide [Pilimelia anulata]GGK06252.1 hypothetical protein GCM10010123_40130 [Pilimelia anulata]
MALLDLQAMELSGYGDGDGHGGWGHGGFNSRASLLLCGDSSLSVTTCN